MKRARRKRTQAAVSLFPFLAVLICTLGVLIILLVLAAKAADVEAREKKETHRQALEQQLTQSKLQLDMEQLRVEGLTQVRPDAVKKMAAVRTHRGHLESEVRRLQQQIQTANAQFAALLNQTPAEQIPPESELETLEQQLAAAKEKLQKVRQDSNNHQATTYSIIPQSTPGGTLRRPIYVECTTEGLTIQPLGVLIKRSDFAENFSPGNPLDAALLAIREYWSRYDLAGEAGQPYPLLVIRPNGAQNYVLARHSMTSWDSEFGYEVVEAEKQLDFGEKDAELEELVRQVVEKSKRRQAYMAQVRYQRARRAQSSNKFGGRPGLVVSGRKGGFVNEVGQPAAFKGGTSNAEPASFDQSMSANSGAAEPTPTFGSVLDRYRKRSHANVETARGRPNPSKSSAQSTPNKVSSSAASTPNLGASAGEGNAAMGNASARPSLASERGANWALPSRTPGATGFLRPVRIICSPMDMKIAKTSKELVTIPFGNSVENSVALMVDTIWQMIDRWGEAGANGYWKPELRFTVTPGAESRYQELRELLKDSGLEIEEHSP